MKLRFNIERIVFLASLYSLGLATDTTIHETQPHALMGLRVDSKESVINYEQDGSIVVESNAKIKIKFFGNLSDATAVVFTPSSSSCNQTDLNANLTMKDNIKETEIEFSDKSTYYICLFIHNWVHQGVRGIVTLKTEPPVGREYYMPLPIQIAIIVVLMILSGLFSGLNLGLMALDKTELKILLKVGDERERKYAEKIYPVRKSGNYLLCTFLLGNVIVNSGISILMDDLTSGFVALIVSTVVIVIFGEIIPQAICSRYGLAVGAYTVVITRFFMVLTFPLSWPISKILDKVLGEEVGKVYNRERLLELIRLSKQQEKGLGLCQEVQIVTGALEFSRKVISDVMTPTKDVFMLPSDTVLDPSTVIAIAKSGFTRIPVYERANRNIIVHILNVKDLALLDPEDKIPLKTICQFYNRPVKYVKEDLPLTVMLEEFKKGNNHLAIVRRNKAEGKAEPIYEVVGLISLEDIIEEIIQSEIRDEYDVIRDSRFVRMKRQETLAAAGSGVKDLAIFFQTDTDACDVSPQLTLATYQYLSTNLRAFQRNLISEHVLRRLIQQNTIKTKPAEPNEQPKCLYQKNQEADYFILILEGKCSTTVGESNILFDSGAFHHFGNEVLVKVMEQCLKTMSLNHPITDMTMFKDCIFKPDFTLTVSHEIIYLKVTTYSYVKAFEATQLEYGANKGEDVTTIRPDSSATTHTEITFKTPTDDKLIGKKQKIKVVKKAQTDKDKKLQETPHKISKETPANKVAKKSPPHKTAKK